MNQDKMNQIIEDIYTKQTDPYYLIDLLFKTNEYVFQKLLQTTELFEQDDALANYYCFFLHKNLKSFHDGIESVIPKLAGEPLEERISHLNKEIISLQECEEIKNQTMIYNEYEKYKTLQKNKIELQSMKQELQAIDLFTLKKEINEMEKIVESHKNDYEKKQQLQQEIQDFADKAKNINEMIDTQGIQHIIKIIQDFQSELIKRTSIRQRIENNIFIEFTESLDNLKAIENRIHEYNELLEICKEDLKITDFYSEFDTDKESLEQIKGIVSIIEPRIKNAILEKEKTLKQIERK